MKPAGSRCVCLPYLHVFFSAPLIRRALVPSPRIVLDGRRSCRLHRKCPDMYSIIIALVGDRGRLLTSGHWSDSPFVRFWRLLHYDVLSILFRSLNILSLKIN